MLRVEVDDSTRNELRRMLNSRPWATLMMAVKTEMELVRKTILAGKFDDLTHFKEQVARYATLKEFVRQSYLAAQYNTPTDFGSLLD